MNTQPQLGDKYVKVNESVFYLSSPALESLREWYNWSVKFDSRVPEELRIQEVDYFAKGFELLKPQSADEVFQYINKNGNQVVNEL